MVRDRFDYGAPWFSSYEKNNYGELFYALIRIYKPVKVVELGTKAGYSAYHIARGLKANGKGSLDCYDLWEKYPFRSVSKSTAEHNLRKFKNIINLKLQDAIGVEKKYKIVDILHVDISNDGEKLEQIIPLWIDKIRQFIIIEGGSLDRDKFDWMIKFKKLPIRKWLHNFSHHKRNIECITLEPFPSVTIIKKIYE